jgi:hypothetical protein
MTHTSMEQSRSIVYDKANVPQTSSRSINLMSIKFMAVSQELKDVRHTLKQVTKERDTLRRELLNCVQII